MSESSDETMLRRCSSSQVQRIRDFLLNDWKIEEYDESDGYVLIKKGFSYKWVKRDGYTCQA